MRHTQAAMQNKADIMGLLDAETLTPELRKKPEGPCGPQRLAGIEFGNTTRVAETLASGAAGPMLLYGMAVPRNTSAPRDTNEAVVGCNCHNWQHKWNRWS